MKVVKAIKSVIEYVVDLYEYLTLKDVVVEKIEVYEVQEIEVVRFR